MSELRDALVEAALGILETGTDLSLRAAARAAGVSAMAPYRHFADKAALLSAIADRGFAALYDRLAEADARPDPHEALLGQGLAYIAFARDRPALFRLMFADPHAMPNKTQRPPAYDVMARRVAALAPDDPDSAALACWSLVHGMAMLMLDGRLAALPPDQERRTIGLFVSGLGRPPT